MTSPNTTQSFELLNEKLHTAALLTENYLKARTDMVFRNPSTASAQDAVRPLFDSFAYSLFAGGKRLRPFLVLEFCKLCGGESEKALPFAAAIEMIHTFSLIHDDLPCMDNDDLRRGKPTNHKVFGEACALLAGDALAFYALETAADCDLPAQTKLSAVQMLTRGAGVCGMIAGQQIDMWAETHPCDTEMLTLLQEKKTGALFETAVLLGCLAAGVPEDSDKARFAKDYAKHIGLAFQIIDDLLDECGDAALLGKNTGSDKQNGKTTFVSLLGIEGAKERAAKEAALAVQALKAFDATDTAVLCALADYILCRKN